MKVDWKGELRLAFVDEDRVTFYTHPDDPKMELTQGKRYAAVLVEIADDERPALPGNDRRAVTYSSRAPSNVSAILCKEEAFQRWAAAALKIDGRGMFRPSEEAATQLVYFRCNVQSRAELDVNPAALRLFQEEVEIPYTRWARSQK